MAAMRSIQVDFPDDLYEQIREAAARSDQPLQAVLVDSLALLFGPPRADWEQIATTLDTLPDAQLWALVYRRVAWSESARLRELTVHGSQAALSAEEHAELAALIDEVDRITLVRSHALLTLQQRGHEIQRYLKPGA
jgi:hypothetical protein